MSRPRMSHDQAFWRIVKDLNWKLDDGRSGPPPPGDPEFIHGASAARARPLLSRSATHVAAFLLGALCWGVATVEPVLLAAFVLWGVGCAGVLAYARRKR